MLMNKSKLTPMMQQWKQCKEQAGDSLLLFRLGDFYEAFYEDAVTLAQNLDIALTQRQGIPMSGIPVSSLDGYVDKLISLGFSIAVAEQGVNTNTQEKNAPLPRSLQRFITPGTLLSSSLLQDKVNNYIVAINRVGTLFGFACLDLSTGAFLLNEYDNSKELFDEICRLAPKEVLSCEKFYTKHADFINQLKQHLQFTQSEHVDWAFEHQFATQKLSSHFQVSSLDGFGLKGLLPAINSAGALLSYIQDKLLLPVEHISIPKIHGKQKHLQIDVSSQTNLELLNSLHNSQKKSSLLYLMERTSTPMGGRLLRSILIRPFYDIHEIVIRQDAVAFLMDRLELRKSLKYNLSQIRDIERLMTKIATSLVTPKEIGLLRDSLLSCYAIHEILQTISLPSFLDSRINISTSLYTLIQTLSQSLLENLPLRILEGQVFTDNYHAELKHLRYIQDHSKEWLIQYQNELRSQTDIKKLKVCYSQAMGYYIEVPSDVAPTLSKEFIRRQSRLHAERFTTEKLQQFQDDMFNVFQKLQDLETRLFRELCQSILHHRKAILDLSQAIADLDYALSLADLAAEYGYCRPIVDNSHRLLIVKGVHPVVQSLISKESFVPNDINMDHNRTRMILLTGPNMAGKSTYIRQTALLVIMAQMGSFIPAQSAHIGIIDKIFTRIGAGDNLSKGMSTFMVEMAETANILHNATDRSLVILDEVGRGTSTYDGLAIAQAVIEYLLFTEGKKAKTLFATHYKELTHLENTCSHVENFHAGVKESGGQPVFLYKILKGNSQKSFGIHVARLAGFPLCVVSRAQDLLKQLDNCNPTPLQQNQERPQQLMLF